MRAMIALIAYDGAPMDAWRRERCVSGFQHERR
jgi:hypothetical protein